jgi:hypothetical protein
VSEQREPYVAGALGSVRQLEGALEATSATRTASEARSWVALLQPPGCFRGTVTDIQTFCFYDATTWTPSLTPPAGCGNAADDHGDGESDG